MSLLVFILFVRKTSFCNLLLMLSKVDFSHFYHVKKIWQGILNTYDIKYTSLALNLHKYDKSFRMVDCVFSFYLGFKKTGF